VSQALSASSLLDPVAWKGTASPKATDTADQIQQVFARLFSDRLTQGGLFADQQSTEGLVAAQQDTVAKGNQAAAVQSVAVTPVARFRQALSQAGLDENQLVVKAEDRPLVESLLRKSGLDEDTTRKVIDQATLTDGSIHLGKVFKALESMTDAADAQLLVPAGLKPVVVQLLTQLGLDPAQINNALSKLETENGSLNLKGLISWLKTQGASGSHVIDPDTLNQLLGSLGLDEDQVKQLLAGRGGPSDPMTATQVADLLRRAGRAQAQGDADVDELLGRLASRLNLISSPEDGRASAQERLLASFKAKVKLGSTGKGDSLKIHLTVKEVLGSDRTAELTGRQLEQALGGQIRTPAGAGTSIEADAKGAETIKGTQAATARSAAPQQAAAAEGLRGEARSLPQTAAAQVIRQASVWLGQMVLRGPNRVTLRLTPPELGQLHLDVVFKDGGVTAHVVADSHAVKQAIEANLDQLRQQLADQGVNVERFDVEVRHQSSGSGDGESNGGRSASRGDGSADEAGPAAVGEATAQSGWIVNGRGGRYINLLA
jgi:flagellar hook-length control protein FliK